jgi:hypothetical protein
VASATCIKSGTTCIATGTTAFGIDNSTGVGVGVSTCTGVDLAGGGSSRLKPRAKVFGKRYRSVVATWEQQCVPTLVLAEQYR